jgi:hypothetical protein
MRFLTHSLSSLLSVAQQDLATLQRWQAVVQNGRKEFDERYYREYLLGERFHGFDDALVRLMELLELPGIGKLLSGTLYVLRTPYRLLKGLLSKAVSRPEAALRPEQPILDEALTGWIDLLRKEAARQSGSHPLWGHVVEGFNERELAGRIRERFQQNYRTFQLAEATEVDRTARAIYEQLEKNPTVLNTLRGGKFTLDMAAIGATVAAGGINWHDFILVPLVASLTHQLVELLGQQVVDTQREQCRQRQQELMREHLSGPLAEWLTQWPATGGTAFERLQTALHRIPSDVQQLEARVKALP